MNTKTYVGVRFDAELHAELRRGARSHNLPISTIVREGTALYLRTLKGRTEEAQRKLVTNEYLALAVDLIISSQYPLDREKLLLEAGRRAEAINAAA